MDAPDEPALPPDDTLREHAYLVSRGVRALAIAGHCRAESLTMLKAATRLEACAPERAFAFVLDRGDGHADLGYAATRWALELYEWVAKGASIPDVHRERIVGLLLGYSADAIRDFEERLGGRRFEGVRS